MSERAVTYDPNKTTLREMMIDVRRRMNGWQRLMRLGFYLALALIVVVMFIPFWWAISISLRPVGMALLYPPKLFPPIWTVEAYKSIFTLREFSLAQTFVNSVKVSAVVTVGRLTICSIAAYAFARMRFIGRQALFLMFLATLMIPGATLLVPTYIIMKTLGWVNTHWPITLPWIMNSTYGVFLLRQYFLSIPMDYDEAAKIEGAGHLRIWATVILPLAKPALAVLMVQAFNVGWNQLLGPMVYISKPRLFTIPMGLVMLQQIQPGKWTWLMAATTCALLPVMIIFMWAQQYFIRGVIASGIKG